MNNAPKDGDSSISAKFLKQVGEYASQSNNMTIQGGGITRIGKGGMGITIDNKFPNSAHPFKVEFFDYVYGDEPTDPENPEGGTTKVITGVQLRVNTGHFLGGLRETIPEEPDLMTESGIVGVWPQKMEYGENEHWGPYRIYWHRQSFEERYVNLKKLAMPNTEVLGHKPKNIFGEYGFQEDFEFDDDSESATNSTQTPFDEVENPMVMEFTKESWGRTCYLVLSYHNTTADGEIVNFEKSLPWLRIVWQNEEEWATKGFNKADFVRIDDPEHPMMKHLPQTTEFEGVKLYQWRIEGVWNYVLAKIVISTDGRPFIKQYVRSDICHFPNTEYYQLKFKDPEPPVVNELHHPFKIYLKDPESQQICIEPGMVNSVMATIGGTRLDVTASDIPSLDPPAEAGTYWVYLACYSDGGSPKFPVAVEVKLSAKDQIYLDDYDLNPDGPHDDAGFIAIGSINTTFETNSNDETVQTIQIHQLVKTSLQAERHKYSESPNPKYYFYRV